MKNQCFGGEYLGEVYDHMLKRWVSSWISVSHQLRGVTPCVTHTVTVVRGGGGGGVHGSLLVTKAKDPHEQ